MAKTPKRNLPLPEYSYRQKQKKEDIKIYKRIALIFAAGIVILAIIVFMGTTFLSLLGTLVNGNTNQPTEVQTENLPLQIPKIDKLPATTNSSTIAVSGRTSPGVEVNLLVNDKESGAMKADTSGSFSFPSIALDEGLNLIKVIATNSSDKKEEASVTITLDKTKPSLVINAPVDGTNYPAGTTKVGVSGTTEAQAKVFINDSQAVVDSAGKFSYNLSVKSGNNSIEVKSTDVAGNVTTVKLAVSVEAAPTDETP